MARAIDEKIVQLRVDKDQFEANLRAAATAMSNLEKTMNGINTTSVDQPTSAFEKLKNTISSISITPIKNMFDFVQNGAASIGKAFSGMFSLNPFSALSKMASSAVSNVTSIFGELGRLNPFRSTEASASESFSGIEKSANSVDMAGLAANVENLGSKFTVMGQVAQGAIQNIGAAISNKLMGGWSTMMEGITGGYEEYTNKMKSIQVIMNNIDNPKLSNVKATLNDLNNYADKTVYSFEDMTYNLGTFTAAGVGLKDAQVAIKGISNLAAASGSNTQQASTAMYQLSQALASGKVGLQDWNSVVNAGMGGQKFQKALSETAKELGHGRDESVSFRDSLQDGWLTSEVLLKTLNKFSKDKSMLQAATQVKSFSDLMDTTIEGIGSGWAQVWENIFGDVEQAPKLWTGVATAIGKPINDMSNYLIKTSNEFNKLGGRAAVIQGLANVFSTLGKILGSIGDAFKSVFPPATGKQVTNMAKGFEKLTENFKVSNSTLKNISDTFKGFFSIIKVGIDVVEAIGALLLKMIPDNLFSIIFEITGEIGRFFTGLANGTKSIDIFDKGARKAGDGINLVKDGVKGLSSVFETLSQVASAIGDALGPVLAGLAKQVLDVVQTITKAFAKSGGFDLNKLLNAGLIVSLIKLIQKFGTTFDEIISGISKAGNPLKDIKKSFVDLIDGATESLSAMTNNIKADTLVKIAGATLLLAASLQILGNINNEDVFKSLEIFAAVMVMVNLQLKSFGKFAPGSTLAMIGASTAMGIMAGAIMTLSVAVFTLSKIDPDKMITALSGLAGMLTMVTATMVTLGKNKTASMAAATAMQIVAGAVLTLSASMALIAAIPTGGVIQGVAAIGAVLLELGVFVRVVSNSKISPATGSGLVLVAGSIVVMAAAIAGLGMLNVSELLQGLSAVTLVIAELIVFTKVANPGQLVGVGSGLVLVASAINILAVGMAGLGMMDTDKLLQGLLGMAGAMGILVIAMAGAQNGLAGAAATVVMAAALNLLIIPLEALAHLSIVQLGIGLLGLAGTLTVLGVAGALLTPAAVGMMAVGAAIALLGVGMAAAGLGISAFVSGMIALAGITASTMVALGVAIGMGLDVIIQSIPKFVTAMNAIIGGIVKVIVTNAPLIFSSFFEVLLKLLDAIDTFLPQIVSKGMQIVTDLANAIADNVGPLIDAGVNLIVQLAEGIARNMDKIIKAGMDLVNSFADGIRRNQTELVNTVLNVIESILEVVVTALSRVMEILFGWIPGFKGVVSDAGKSAKDALRDAFDIDNTAKEKTDQFNAKIAEGAPNASTAGKTLADAAKGGIDLADFSPVGAVKGTQFNAGLTGTDAFTAGNTLGNNANAGANAVNMTPTGSTKGSEFAGGVASQTGNASGAGDVIAQAAKTAAGAPTFAPTGTNKGAEFAGGVAGQRDNASGAGDTIAQAAKTAAGNVSLSGTGSNKGSEFAGGVAGQSNNARGAGSSLSENAKQGAGSADFHGTGSSKGTQFNSGVSSQDGYGAGADLAGKTKRGLESADTHSAGSNAGKGFFEGLGSWAHSISEKASEMADSVNKMMKKKLDIHSPSRVTRKLGKFTGQGFALGLDGQMSNVKSSSMDMAQAALAGLADLNDQIQDSIGVLDLSANVTPVMDMSQLAIANQGVTVGVNGYNPMASSFGVQTPQQIDKSTHEVTNQITIYQQPGETGDSLVQKIQEALDKKEF